MCLSDLFKRERERDIYIYMYTYLKNDDQKVGLGILTSFSDKPIKNNEDLTDDERFGT